MTDQPRTIQIRIETTGEITAVTHGMKGDECLPYIKRLEELLEAETVDSEYTSEFHETRVTPLETVDESVSARGDLG